jgi:hypothetical protein
LAPAPAPAWVLSWHAGAAPVADTDFMALADVSSVTVRDDAAGGGAGGRTLSCRLAPDRLHVARFCGGLLQLDVAAPPPGAAAAPAAPLVPFAAFVDAVCDAARGMAPYAKVILRALDLVEIDPAHGADLVDRHVSLTPVPAVTPTGFKRQGLQSSAFRKATGRPGKEAVQKPVLPILCQVDRPSFRIDRRRLMLETAHCGQGNRSDRPGCAGRDLKDPAMAGACSRSRDRCLLAGQP